jgi:hypothetical protein
MTTPIKRSQLRDPKFFQDNLEEIIRQHGRGEIIDDRPEKARKLPRANINQHPGHGRAVYIDTAGPKAEPPAVEERAPRERGRAAGSDFSSNP